MKILVVAATKGEIAPLMEKFSGQNDPEVLITGVGAVATAFALGSLASLGSYDLALNLGVAGSFSAELPPGSICQVTSDCFADLGAEDGRGFIDLFEMGLAERNTPPYSNGKLLPTVPSSFTEAFQHIPTAGGITVNTVHGSTTSIEQVVKRLDPEVETMEGAAFFYACALAGQPCAQIRTISNKVEKRNRAAWKLEEAIDKLNSFAIELIRSMTKTD